MSEIDSEQPPKHARLDEQVKEAVRLTKIVPKEHQAKAFEILLNLTCSPGFSTYNVPESRYEETDNGYDIQGSVRAFMTSFDIQRPTIEKQFIITGPDEIDDNYSIKKKPASTAQIGIACMIALKHALRDGSFEFSFKEVEDACKENDCFNDKTFIRNFKRHSKLFKSLDNKDQVILTSSGKKFLAKLLNKLSA